MINDNRMTDEQVREKLKRLDRFIKEANSFATWDTIIPIAPHGGKLLGLEGEFNDWPKYVQDRIMGAIVTQCIPKPGYRIGIVGSGCYQDVAWEPAYLRIIVQEFPPAVRH